MDGFDEQTFRNQVYQAISDVKKILDNARVPEIPESVSHKYDDKYLLAEFLTNTSMAATLNCFDLLGISPDLLNKFKEWSKTRTVTLRFSGVERCDYLREVEREVESPKYVTDIEYGGIKKTSIETKVVTKVKEYFWKFSSNYRLSAYQGNLVDDQIFFRNSEENHEVKTTSKDSPRSKVSSIGPFEVNITWLLENLNDKNQVNFKINRKDEVTCRTPRRNHEIDSARNYFYSFARWSEEIKSYLFNDLFNAPGVDTGLDKQKIPSLSASIFNPSVPLFESIENQQVKRETTVLPIADLNLFLNHQKQTFLNAFSQLENLFPASGVINSASAKLIAIVHHAIAIFKQLELAVDYIEHLLYTQLIAAIGKVVTPDDFTNYMVYHNRKLFKPVFEPQKFSYAIRRPDHYPEGIISIESSVSDISDPIPTIVSLKSTSDSSSRMSFPINAATNIHFTGERYLHGFVGHSFPQYSKDRLFFNARARQFSSFIVLLGRITSATEFQPKYGLIVKNRDSISIPLELEQIPTPKQFRDAIESLSPEQQAFAKAYRSMQLESTLFGILVIQIKPQLERVLNLPNDSLTKEIQLTEDLQDLFIRYQIPSDLLSYSGKPDAPESFKIEAVKAQVKIMMDMIENAKKKEIDQAKQVREATRLVGAVSSSVQTVGPTFSGSKRHVVRKGKSNKVSKGGAAIKKDESDDPSGTGQVDKEKQWNEATDENFIDFTKIPILLDGLFEQYDEDSALHSTIINVSDTWTKEFQKDLLSKPEKRSVGADEQARERSRTFDLLDSLTRSGVFGIDDSSLHVVLAATHSFDRTLMRTVIQDNINPIEKVERSNLIISSAIHNVPVIDLIKEEHLERVIASSPKIFE